VVNFNTNLSSNTSNFTAAMWIYPYGLSSNQNSCIWSANTSSNIDPFGSGVAIMLNNGTESLTSSATVQFSAAGGTGGPSIPARVWTHLALTYSFPGVGIGYINGVAVISSNTGSARPLNVQGLGYRFSDFASEAFSGIIDEFRVYTRALCNVEIANLASESGSIAVSGSLAVAGTLTASNMSLAPSTLAFPGWTLMTLQSGFSLSTSGPPPAFYKDHTGRVWLRGFFNASSSGTMAYLPSNCWPSYPVIFNVNVAGNDTRINNTNGAINVNSGGGIEGLSFMAAPN
jgi:hypothetical protein